MDRFTIPRDLYYGRGALSRLKQLNGSRAMLVCGAAARQSGFLRRAEGFLQEAGMLVRPFICAPGGPTLALALTGAKAMQEFKPGWIVALGGEESISAAKAMWAFYEDPGLTPRAFLEEGRLPLLRRQARMAAAPAGGGGEAALGGAAFLLDPAQGRRHLLRHPVLAPDMAIIDPDLAAPCSGTILARGGMAALSQALEAMFHGQASLAYPLALHAACVIFDKLQPAAGGDVAARTMLHEGQCMAGLAFSNAPAGLCTAMAAELCVAFYKPLPTGIAEAVCLPLTLSRDPGAKNAAARICASLGYPGECLEALRSRIILLRGGLDMPESLQAFGIEEAEFLSKLPDLCKRLSHTSILPKNRCPTPKDAEELFRQAYYGS
ncbi:MAG: iron-containing alcohol dehydrogenase [Christensenellales bacterium]|nr:iron-containing alcohol dehydrogenase [Christensenellales bacterium]